MNVLFIGGHADGERADLPEGTQNKRLAVTPPIKYNATEALTCESFEIEDYDLFHLQGDDRQGNPQTFHFMALRGMWPADILKRLCLGYQPVKRAMPVGPTYQSTSAVKEIINEVTK